MTQSRSRDDFGWRSRGYLPHFDNGECSQFITTRLHDSMPQNVLKVWELELQEGKIEDADLRKRIEEYLDRGYGSCSLRIPEIAEMVCETLLKDDGVKYNLHSYVVMPNHLHFLITQFPEVKISEITQTIKSVTSHRANKILGRTGPFWYPEPFDRYIREPKHFFNVIRYIEMNPVKAKLCRHPELWPYTSAGKIII